MSDSTEKILQELRDQLYSSQDPMSIAEKIREIINGCISTGSFGPPPALLQAIEESLIEQSHERAVMNAEKERVDLREAFKRIDAENGRLIERAKEHQPEQQIGQTAVQPEQTEQREQTATKSVNDSLSL